MLTVITNQNIGKRPHQYTTSLYAHGLTLGPIQPVSRGPIAAPGGGGGGGRRGGKRSRGQ